MAHWYDYFWPALMALMAIVLIRESRDKRREAANRWRKHLKSKEDDEGAN